MVVLAGQRRRCIVAIVADCRRRCFVDWDRKGVDGIQLHQRQGEAPADDAPEPGRGELLLAMRRLPTLTLPMAQLAVLLIAIYYLAQIFLFGAVFTRVYASHFGSKREG